MAKLGRPGADGDRSLFPVFGPQAMETLGFPSYHASAAFGGLPAGVGIAHAAGGDVGTGGLYRILVSDLPDPVDERQTVLADLLAPEARIASKYFYDPAGCELFAEICRLPEYYLTRTEVAIFARYRRQIAAYLPMGAQWLDLGCGDGRKSHPWLDAIMARRFIGVDIAHQDLVQAVDSVARSHRGIECLGVVTDLSRPLRLQALLYERAAWPTVVFYPGSSLGNFTPAAAIELLTGIREHLDDRGALLIGVDLVKETQFLEAAYDDDQEVTAAFNRNILRVVNRLADADFDPDQFDHWATFAADASRIEMRLRARRPLTVHIGPHLRHFAAGETILTEYSYKFTVAGFVAMLDAAGFSRQHIWTDQRGWFGVVLAQP